MISIFSSKFDRLVSRYFEPLADRTGLKLVKVSHGIFEIAGKTFVVRIRLGTGHKTDFLVTLSSEKSKKDIADLSNEIGLGVIAEYYKQPLRSQDFASDEEIHSAFLEAANTTEALCLPYLLGIRDSVADILEFVEEKIASSGIRDKKYRFPPNVREEWL